MILRRRQLLTIDEAVSERKLRAQAQQRVAKRRATPPQKPRGKFSWRWNGSAYFTKPSLNKGDCPPTYTTNRSDDQCNPTKETPGAPYEKVVEPGSDRSTLAARLRDAGRDWPVDRDSERVSVPYPATESEKWFDEASKFEREAAEIYSAGQPHAWGDKPRVERVRDERNAYRRINALLRGQDKKPDPEDVKLAKALNKATHYDFKDEHGRPRKQIVYRGVKTPANGPMSAEEHAESILDYYEQNIGKPVKMDGLISTSTGVGSAALFAKGGFMFEIRTPKGLPLQQASQTKIFDEILLGNGWAYKVVDVKRDSWFGNQPLALVMLEVVDTPLDEPKVEPVKEVS